MGRVLFVLAHQDDEVAMATRILFHVRQRDEVHCTFLTDGAAGGDAGRRDGESLRALRSLGVPAGNVHFPPSSERIADGSLPMNLPLAIEQLEKSVGDQTIDHIYCLAWEGGHQDHDASHIVAVALAKRLQILDRCREVPLYNGKGTTGPLFRVMSRVGAEWTPRTISFSDALKVIALLPFYRTQLRSWTGLAPELLLKTLLLRREVVRPVRVKRILSSPHDGTLFYERRFGFSYERFRDAVNDFLTSEGLR